MVSYIDKIDALRILLQVSPFKFLFDLALLQLNILMTCYYTKPDTDVEYILRLILLVRNVPIYHMEAMSVV